MRKLIFATIAVAGLSAALTAQEPAKVQQDEAARKRELEVLATAARASFGVESRITTGAPYSAEAVTESNQVLADGNRISRKTVSRIYRDGEGRTRREEIDTDTGAVKSAVISDPVGHLSYTLDPATRTALRSQVFVATPAGVLGGRGGRGAGPVPIPEGGAAGARGRVGGGGVMTPAEAAEASKRLETEVKALADAKATYEARMAAEGKPAAPVAAPALTPALRGGGPGSSGETTREELGNQTIEGVIANGSRSTTVIPAGAIGNLQPIKIVSEQWMANDLKVLVLTRFSDPRTGETTYKLQNIVRAEPDRSLFSPPPDYTVKDRSVRGPVIK